MASRFWVGGTGAWDNADTTHWSATSGGAGGSSVPASVDTVTFDGSSGGGTVTVAATINASNTLVSLTCGAFTGTLDFATNNPSITFTLASSPNFSISGTGARTINGGTGTFTMVGNNGSCFDAATTTNLSNPTTAFANATLVLNNPANGNGQTFAGGGLTYGTLSIGAHTGGAGVSLTGNNTFTTLSMTAPVAFTAANASTTTITNAFAWNGSSSAQLSISNTGSDSKATFACAVGSVISWALIRGTAFTGTTVVATNSFDLKNNSGSTITAPVVGGAVGVIGS
jgi:hypothetical protein